jgi:hypothetical protein
MLVLLADTINHCMKHYHYTFILLIAFFGLAKTACAQRTDQPWQVDVAAGMHTIYAPVKDLKWRRPELLTTVGVGKPLGHKQAFNVTLFLGYARNNYMGDALYLQLLGQYTPLIAGKIEPGIGLGFGYRLALYPSQPHAWDGSQWKAGRPYKGVLQVPVQLSVGYRSIQLQSYEVRPYVAYQLQTLFNYNHDFSPLTVSAGLLGIKVQNSKK